MKFSTTAIALAAALGANALPSNHAHGHHHVHRSIEQRDEGVKFVMNQKPAPPPATTKEAPKAKPTQVVNNAAIEKPKEKKPKEEKPKEQKPSPPKGSGGTGQGISTYTEFCGGSSSKRATLAEIHYKGNLGTADNYGCNMMLAQKEVAKEYKYSIQLKNVSGKENTCTCFLKVGPTGGINGFFKGNEVLSFKIPEDSEQWVVVDKNTQGSCSCTDEPTMPYTKHGETGGTWAEFDFENESNNGWSGSDASCLTASRHGMKIPGMRICAESSGSPCSTIYPGGAGTNAFTEGMEAEDGWGINAYPGPLTLNVEVGYQG